METVADGMRADGREGTPRVDSHPHVQNSEKYPDCRTDLIGGGGNIDVCPGRQTPSCRHCPRFLVQDIKLWISKATLFHNPRVNHTVHVFTSCWPAVPLYAPTETSLYFAAAESTSKSSYSAYLVLFSKSPKSTRSRWRVSDVSKWRLSLPADASNSGIQHESVICYLNTSQ